MVCFTSGKDRPNLYCEWQSEQARCPHLASGFPAVLSVENVVLYTLLQTLVLDEAKRAEYWPQSFCCMFMNLDYLVIHEDCTKELQQISRHFI